MYYLKDRPLLDVTVPANWTPERKYVDTKKNNEWLISRGKKPLEKRGVQFVLAPVCCVSIILMRRLLFLLLVGFALSVDTERDLQSVYSKSDYDRVFNVHIAYRIHE